MPPIARRHPLIDRRPSLHEQPSRNRDIAATLISRTPALGAFCERIRICIGQNRYDNDDQKYANNRTPDDPSANRRTYVHMLMPFTPPWHPSPQSQLTSAKFLSRPSAAPAPCPTRRKTPPS